MKKLTIVIVSYNVRYYLEQCIDSVLRAADGIDYEIYVVDNASQDGSVDYLKQRFANQITLIESQHNLGFARANNIAISQTKSEYVLLLNPDTFISETSIHQVLTFMDEHPKAGGVGVRMHNADGSLAPESRRGLPTPWVSLKKMLGFSGHYYMSHLPWDEPGRIEVMSGAFCMLRREAIDRVGSLDERFFMYGEDIDLSYRILKGGYENWYVPASIVHYKGESTQKSSYRYVHVFYQAMLIFFRKHYSHLSFFVTLPVKLAIYFRALVALVQMQHWRVRKYLGTTEMESNQTYFFVGSKGMLGECRQLARRKGVATGGFLEDLLLLDAEDISLAACVIYDKERFSFQQIIDCAARLSGKGVVIGTYSTRNKILITPKDIMQ